MLFLRTFFDLCSSFSASTRLFLISPARAVFHSFLLLLICSVAIATAASCREKAGLSRMTDRFVAETRGVELTENSIRMLKTGTNHFIFSLNERQFRFDAIDEANLGSFDLKNYTEAAGVVLLPKMLCCWSASGDDSYSVVSLPASALYALAGDRKDANAAGQAHSRYFSSSADALAFMKNEGIPAGDEKIGEGKPETVQFSASAIVNGILAGLWFFAFFLSATEILFLMALMPLCFAAAQYFRFASAVKGRLSFRNFFVLTIYATFPATAAASLWQIFQLPWLSFQAVFFIVFFVYQIFYFNAFAKKMIPQPPKRDDSDYGDDDF